MTGGGKSVQADSRRYIDLVAASAVATWVAFVLLVACAAGGFAQSVLLDSKGQVVPILYEKVEVSNSSQGSATMSGVAITAEPGRYRLLSVVPKVPTKIGQGSEEVLRTHVSTFPRYIADTLDGSLTGGLFALLGLVAAFGKSRKSGIAGRPWAMLATALLVGASLLGILIPVLHSAKVAALGSREYSRFHHGSPIVWATESRVVLASDLPKAIAGLARDYEKKGWSLILSDVRVKQPRTTIIGPSVAYSGAAAFTPAAVGCEQASPV